MKFYKVLIGFAFIACPAVTMANRDSLSLIRPGFVSVNCGIGSPTYFTDLTGYNYLSYTGPAGSIYAHIPITRHKLDILAVRIGFNSNNVILDDHSHFPPAHPISDGGYVTTCSIMIGGYYTIEIGKRLAFDIRLLGGVGDIPLANTDVIKSGTLDAQLGLDARVAITGRVCVLLSYDSERNATLGIGYQFAKYK